MPTVQQSRIRALSFNAVDVKQLETFCIAALMKVGVIEESARITAKVLVTTDTFGTHSHGTYHLANYVKKIRAGGIEPKAKPVVISEGQGWAMIDGQSSIAMATSCMAMEIAIKKAQSNGIGFVGVKNSNHFGAAGYYANMAAQNSLIGLAMSSGNPNMTAPGARGSVVGNNPFAYAAPYEGGRSIFMDIATSAVAASKLMTSKSLGKEIPNTWIVDEEGVPTTDISKYPNDCSLQPMAAHKGYGLAVMIEILAAALTGAAVTDEIESWLLNLPHPTRMGHSFIAIDVSSISPLTQFHERMDHMVRGIHQAPKAKGHDRIFLPGEIEWEKREKTLKDGLYLPEEVLESLSNLADAEGLDLLEIFMSQPNLISANRQ
jgi:ureidoglycolate dehydrogenase (NAD+)